MIETPYSFGAIILSVQTITRFRNSGYPIGIETVSPLPSVAPKLIIPGSGGHNGTEWAQLHRRVTALLGSNNHLVYRRLVLLNEREWVSEPKTVIQSYENLGQ